jgi:hypothetical protein
MQSDHHEPINLGQDRMVTVDELVDMVAAAEVVPRSVGFEVGSSPERVI